MNRYEIKVLKSLSKNLDLLPNDKLFQLLEWFTKNRSKVLSDNVPFKKIELKNFIKIYCQCKYYCSDLINFDWYSEACKKQNNYIDLQKTDFYQQLFEKKKKIIQQIFNKIIEKINELILYKKIHQESIESLNQVIRKYRNIRSYGG